VDGRAEAVERANGDFIGVVVPAGEHTVSLEFSPTHLAVGRAVTLAGLAVAAALASAAVFLTKRRGARVNAAIRS
jgi:uncharacterized membrane protein YfhO